MKFSHKIYLAFLLLGVILTILSFVGFLNSIILFLIFTLIVLLFLLLLLNYFFKLGDLTKNELLFSYIFIIIWSLHFLQVLVPESGFDALWYHLPVVENMIQKNGISFLLDTYQSVNPLFSDLYFLSGFSVLGVLGSKIIAYIFGLLFVFSSYSLSKLFLSRKFSIIVAVIVSTFQVVAWQSSSFYVDVAKGFFEISGLVFLLFYTEKSSQKSIFKNSSVKNKSLSLLFFSASLATKLFSLLLIPTFIYIYKIKNFFSKKILINILLLFGVPALYYYFTYVSTGNPFYAISVHVNNISNIGGQQNLLSYFIYKIFTFPKSIMVFALARDYVTPIIVIFLIPIVFNLKLIFKKNDLTSHKLKTLLIFGFTQWIIWWFVPPLSTRYALSGFVVLLILGLTLTINHLPILRMFLRKMLFNSSNKYKHTLTILISIYILLATVPRIIVAYRSLKYILTPQTQRQYLEQFYDGSIDEKINNWYFR